ncbi:MAG: hypothetical protein ACJ71N_12535 [Terriglobales bacterium]|jgi:hypothetical protein
MAPAEDMPLHGKNPESHVLAAAAAQESTMKILQAARPQPKQEPRERRPQTSFIEDVEGWIRKYLNLADEVLQNPAEPDMKSEKDPAA